MKATKPEIDQRYIPALVELSKLNIDGKIAYACARNVSKIESELSHVEKSRLMILESRASKDKDGKPMTHACLKEEGTNEDGTPKMVPVISQNGQAVSEYVYASEEEKKAAIDAVDELHNNPIEIDIYAIPASQIQEVKSISGSLIYRLGEIIDDNK